MKFDLTSEDSLNEEKQSVRKKKPKDKKIKKKLEVKAEVEEDIDAPIAKAEAKKNKKQLRKTIEIHPVKSWGSDPRENFLRYRYGYFEIVRMRGHNLFGMKTKEFLKITSSYAALTNLYSPPFKLVSVHSPVDTSSQQAFFKRRLPIRRIN